jgi:hypothetical protein
MKWEGSWKGGDKSLKDAFKLDKGPLQYSYVGFYTLEGYNSSDVQRYMSGGSWVTSFKTTKMPDRTVMFLAIAYGEKLYFISDNRTENDVRVGVLSMSGDNLFYWSEQPADKVKKLKDKGGVAWYRDK